jgi:hypothetical protein
MLLYKNSRLAMRLGLFGKQSLNKNFTDSQKRNYIQRSSLGS